MSELHIEVISGACPLEAEGTICGKLFYFRARGRRWMLTIDDDPTDPLKKPEWWAECTWGVGKFDAGWMSEDEARRLIEWCAAEYAQNAARASPAAIPEPDDLSHRGDKDGRHGANLEGKP